MHPRCVENAVDIESRVGIMLYFFDSPITTFLPLLTLLPSQLSNYERYHCFSRRPHYLSISSLTPVGAAIIGFHFVNSNLLSVHHI